MTISFATFFVCTISVFLEKIVSGVFPPIFWSRYSCEYIETFFRTFIRQFFPNIFCSHYSSVSERSVSRFFFGLDIRVKIKNCFCAFLRRYFFHFFARTIRVFLEKLLRSFCPPIFWSRYSCEYKKMFFALFSDDFFPSFFAHTIHVFLQKLFRAFISFYFLVTIFVWIFINDLGIFFRRFFSQNFLHALFLWLWKNCFARFFSAIFWSRYSCEYKKIFLEIFSDVFFSTFSLHYSNASGKMI